LTKQKHCPPTNFAGVTQLVFTLYHYHFLSSKKDFNMNMFLIIVCIGGGGGGVLFFWGLFTFGFHGFQRPQFCFFFGVWGGGGGVVVVLLGSLYT